MSHVISQIHNLFSNILTSCPSKVYHLQELFAEDVAAFWSSFGHALGARLPDGKLKSMESPGDFLDAFPARIWCERRVVILIDELSVLYRANAIIRTSFFAAFRELKSDKYSHSVQGVVACGTFGVNGLSVTGPADSPFNVADQIQNLNFSGDELFKEFSLNQGIAVEPDVVDDIWVKSNGCVWTL